MPRFRPAAPLPGVVALLAFAFAPAAAPAASVTWTNGAANYAWDTTSNDWSTTTWTNDGTNGALFSSSTAGVVGAITVNTAISANSLSFTVAGYSLAGSGTITLTNTGTGSTTLGGINVAPAANTTTISVPIAGTAGLLKLGAGNLKLGAVNTYSGATVVQAGTLTLGVANALPTATDLTLGLLTGAGNATGILALGGFNQTVASLTIAAPSTSTAAAKVSGVGTLTVNGAISLVNNSGTPNDLYGGTIGTLGSTVLDLGGGVRTVTVTSQNISPELTFNAVIQNGGVNYVGQNLDTTGTAGFAADITFAAANTFTGGLTVTSGVVNVAAAGTLGGPTNVITFAASGTAGDGTNALITTASAQTIGGLAGGTTSGTATSTFTLGGALTIAQAANTTFTGIVTGAFAVTKSGNGTLTLQGANTYSGTTTITAGTTAGGGITFSGAGTALSATALTVGGGTTLRPTLTFDNTATSIGNRYRAASAVTLNNGAITLIGNSSGTATAMGALTVTGDATTGSVVTVNSTTAQSTLTFASLAAIPSTAALYFAGNNLLDSGGGLSKILFTTAPTLNASGYIDNAYVATASGTLDPSRHATYSAANGIYLFVLAPTASGTVIDNVGGPQLGTGVAFTTTGNTTANTGAKLSSVTLDQGSTLNLVQTYAPSAANGNTPIDTLALTNSIIAQTSPKTVTASTAGTVAFGSATIQTDANLTFAPAVTVTGNGLAKAGAATLTFNGPNGITGDYAINAGTVVFATGGSFGNLSGTAGAVATVPAGTTLTSTGTAATTYAGSFAGAGTFVKAGTVNLTLSGDNTAFTGTLSVTAGALVAPTAAGLGTGTVLLNNGQVNYSGPTATLAAALTTGASGGSVSVTTAATVLTLAGPPTLNGFLLKVGAGTLQLAPGTAFTTTQQLQVNAGTLDVNGNALTVGSLAGTGGTLALGGTAFTDTQTTATTFSGVISGTGSVTMNGTGGVLTLAGANTYTGGTVVTAGTIKLGVAAAIAPGSNITIAPGATFDTAGFAAAAAAAVGTITVNGGTLLDSSATSATNYYLNRLVLAGGTVDFSAGAARKFNFAGTAAGIQTNASGVTATITGANSTTSRLVNNLTAGTPLPVVVAAGTTPSGIDLNVNAQFASSGSSVLFDKQGPGVLLVSYPGTTTASLSVSGGTLLFNGSLTTGTLTATAGGTLGGTGFAGGAVAVNAGGTLAPGGLGTVGTLTINATAATATITGGSGTTWTVKLNAVAPNSVSAPEGSAVSQLVNGGTGSINLVPGTPGSGAQPITFNLQNLSGTFTAGQPVSYAIATASGGGAIQENGTAVPSGSALAGVVGTDYLFTGVPASNYSLSVQSNSLVITFTPAAVPEPAGLLALAATALGLRRLRRRAVRSPRSGESANGG